MSALRAWFSHEIQQLKNHFTDVSTLRPYLLDCLPECISHYNGQRAGRPACRNAFHTTMASEQAGLPAGMHFTLQWPAGRQACLPECISHYNGQRAGRTVQFWVTNNSRNQKGDTTKWQAEDKLKEFISEHKKKPCRPCESAGHCILTFNLHL